MARARLHQSFRAVLRVLFIEMVVLTASGVYLTFRYFPKVGGVPLHAPDVIRGLHRICAWAMLATAVLLLILVLLRAWPSGPARVPRPKLVGVGATCGLIVLTVVGLRTGLHLPWDEVALRAVRVGTHLAGYSFLWHDNVRFILAAGREVTTASLLHRFLLHVVISGLGSAALVAAVWVPNRKRLRGTDHRRRRAAITGEMNEEPASYLN